MKLWMLVVVFAAFEIAVLGFALPAAMGLTTCP